MALSRIINRLLELPLFLGMSNADLGEIVAHTRFDFHKVPAGRTIVAEGDVCNGLNFVTDGTVIATVRADDGSYSLHEELKAPCVVQPHRLFGMTQRHSRTFTAATSCNVLFLSKPQLLQLIDNFEVFRINLLNTVTTQSQRQEHLPLRQPAATIRDKVLRFITDRSLYPVGKKKLEIKMEVLAHLIGESRRNLSVELHLMERDGIISLNRGVISMMPNR